MLRNRYDTDAMTWSPAGRLLQVEYAMAAVDQGYAAVGLRSSTHVVLAAVNNAPSDVSSHQHKIFKVGDHVAIATAGLAADSRALSQYLRDECINHAFVYEAPLPVGRLVVRLADKAQARTRRLGRPYGVGVLVAGSDDSGVHLYYTCPSGNYSEYWAFAIGYRSLAANSFLERRCTLFNWYCWYSEELLVNDAILAIKQTLPGQRLTGSVCTVAVAGVGERFRFVDPGTVQKTVEDMEKRGEIVY